MLRGKILLFLLTGLFFINFVSAYYYGSYSFSNMLSSIDESTIMLGSVFIVSFAILSFALSRFFRENKTTATVISLVISLLIVWGINRTGFDVEGLFYRIGFSPGVLYTLAPLIIVAGIILMGIKWGWGQSLVLVGLFFIGASFFVYESATSIIIGVVLLIVGGILWIKYPGSKEIKT